MKKLFITALMMGSLSVSASTNFDQLKNKTLSTTVSLDKSDGKTDCSTMLAVGQLTSITTINHYNAMKINLDEYVATDDDNIILSLGLKRALTDMATLVILRGEESLEKLDNVILSCSDTEDTETAGTYKDAVNSMYKEATTIMDALND